MAATENLSERYLTTCSLDDSHAWYQAPARLGPLTAARLNAARVRLITLSFVECPHYRAIAFDEAPKTGVARSVPSYWATRPSGFDPV